ncbi:hypothetical protein [Roseomonas sp. BN140053]|uniref:hypothetical protein n=1 Tax=Roseomonas sp. BN140053 TaxID=3391898 RepID=UPI0039E7CF6C
MRMRFLPALALAACLGTAACQHPDGSTDWGSTLALGAGVGLAGALIAGAASDDGPRHGYRSSRRYDGGGGYGRGGYGRSSYAQGYGRGGRW